MYIQIFNAHREECKDYTPIFTDGSKTVNHVGCAYVIGNNIVNHQLHVSFSVFTAEATAIFIALKYILSQQRKKFMIYSDSMSVLVSIKSPNHRTHPLVLKIIELLHSLEKRGYIIHLCWIPGHVGIKGNELADIAAKCANRIYDLPVPFSDMKKLIIQITVSKWQDMWNMQANNKLHRIKPDIGLWVYNRSRRLDVILTRLRIGHSYMTHAHLLNGEDNPVCKYCSSILTINHILIDCPHFKNSRIAHFNTNSPNTIDLLGEEYHEGVFPFLKTIGLFLRI